MCHLDFKMLIQNRQNTSTQGSLKFREVSIYKDKKGHRFQLCHQFLAGFPLDQNVVMFLTNDLVHRVRPPLIPR